MSFYAFRLNRITVTNPRGKVPDNDIVVFQLEKNTVLKGQGTIFLQALTAGTTIALVTPPSNTYTFRPFAPQTKDRINDDWIIGPFDVGPADGVAILYSGTNKSDSPLNETEKEQLELRIADVFLTTYAGAVAAALPGAGIGALIGTVSDALGKVFDVTNVFKDPVGQFIGYSPTAQCDGVVFSGLTKLTGADLGALQYVSPSAYNALPESTEFTTSVTLTDKANHSDACGEAALTDISFSVLKVERISLSYYIRQSLSGGIRRLVPGAQSISVRALLNL